MIENASLNYCRPKVTFTYKEWNIKGKKVLEINVPASSDHPHKAPDQSGKYKAYIRSEDENILADGVLVKVWNKEKSNQDIQLIFTDELQNILQFIDKNEPVTTNDLHTNFNLSKFKAEHLLSDLIILDIVKMDDSDIVVQFYLTELNEH